MDRRSVLAAGLAGALMAAGAAPAHAAMTADGLTAPAGAPLVQLAQLPFPNPIDFLLGGHSYCWYDDGWRGGGWYWCGYGYRQGFGWGGGEEWGYGHGWREHRSERDWHGHGGDMHGGGMHGGGMHHGDMHMHGGMHPGGGGGHGGGGHGGGGHGGGEHKHP